VNLVLVRNKSYKHTCLGGLRCDDSDAMEEESFVLEKKMICVSGGD
jgi:hypothetical protein